MFRCFTKGSTAVGLLAVLLILLGAVLAACGGGTTDTTAASAATTLDEPQSLTVSAASSLKAAFTAVGEAFDKANNVRTTFNFDASGTLQKQIEAGAEVDVFAAAAMKQVNALLEQNLLDQASVKVFASNEIVLALPANSALAIASFDDLTKDDVKKVAYGDPAVAPHGVYAEETLTTLGIFDQVKPKVIYTKNVSQTVTYVTSGEVDAGIMFSTDAVAAADKVKVAATADAGSHSQIVYPVAIVSSSTSKDLARAFVDFLMSSEGQSMLQGQGFVAPPAQ